MRRKILVIMLIGILSLSLIGCGGEKDIYNEETPIAQEEIIEKEEINIEEYKQAVFTELNIEGDDYVKLMSTKVFIEGTVGIVDMEGEVFDTSPNILMNQVEGEGLGVYYIKGYELKDCGFDITTDDAIKVYGTVYYEKISGIPTIQVDKVDKI